MNGQTAAKRNTLLSLVKTVENRAAHAPIIFCSPSKKYAECLEMCDICVTHTHTHTHSYRR